jgi:hypothetical protein
MSLPAILPPSDASSCLCKRCLLEKINNYIVALAEKPIKDQVDVAKPYRQAPPQEGLDYHFEQGLMVFRRWYHLRRGTCCGNGCRHCPYSKSR